ncbi:MAG TPA: TetR/AcrR family transcriptional regulator [Gemmatimonadaceae bacterium]
MADQQVVPPRAERDGDTERRILQAARTVFVRRGTAGARMQEIAEEAGVNQALLHYYFRSKDRLAAAVFREAASRLVPAIVAVLGSDDPVERKVERFVHLYVDTVRQNPFIPGYIVSEMHHHPERLRELVAEATDSPAEWVRGAFLDRVGAQLASLAAAGEIRPIAPHQFLVNLAALCVFPFLARPLLETAFALDAEAFGRFLDERRAELPGFILAALRP